MTLRSRGSAQLVIAAAPPQAVAAASSSVRIRATASLDREISPPSSLPHYSDNPQPTPPTPLPALTSSTVPDHVDEETPDTQIVGSGNRFPEDIIANLANLEAKPPTPENPGTQVISRVSRLRRVFANMSNLDPTSPTDNEEEFKIVTQATEVQTQAVVSKPFSVRALNELGNVNSSIATAQDLSTQIVSPGASFSEGMPRGSGNVSLAQASASEAATQVVPSRPQFSGRMIAELGNVDLDNMEVTHAPVLQDEDYDDGTTIQTFSQIPESDTPRAGVAGSAASEHTAIKSWASGSLTTSMRGIVGLPPKPLKGGKLRPVPEDLGPAPPRWPCEVKVLHSTCGHTYRTVVHSHICYYFDAKPGERIYKELTPEHEILDEWGLPPSAQPPARTQDSTQSRTQVITEGNEECYESTTSIVLTGKPCEECKAE